MLTKHQHLHLIGDIEENFYLLGRKDKDAYQEMYQQISMLCARNQKTAQLVKLTTELAKKLLSAKTPQSILELKAYSEGLERNLDDVIYALLLPEIVASFNKWVPNLIGLIPGCSSLFTKKQDQVFHGRILDYALSGPFEKYERSLLFELNGQKKIFCHSSVGLPLPSLTAMNEDGLSLALHYKHGEYFNFEGDSIFTIAHNLLLNCSDIREAIKFLKGQESISYWGIYIADKSGEVASIDIRGRETHKEIFDLNDHDYLYFNNRPLLKQQDQDKLQPFGNLNQCLMRKEHFKQQMTKIDLDSSKNIQQDILKVLSSYKPKKAKTAKNWLLPTVTPSSIQMCSFNLTESSSLLILEDAPKTVTNSQVKIENIFEDIDFTEYKSKKTPEFFKSYRRLAKFQSKLDSGKVEEAYHEIQMAIKELEGHPEQLICRFFFIITQYIFESDKRDYAYLYQDLQDLEDKLPSYLNDHRLLFLLRIGKILGQREENRYTELSHPGLKEYYKNEFNLNAMAIKTMRNLTFPRIEILDIIYAY